MGLQRVGHDGATRYTHECAYSPVSTPVVVQKSPPSNSRTFSFCKIGPDLLDVANTLKGTLLQYSCLKNPMDDRAWWAVVHGLSRTQTQLSDFTFTFHFHALEKEMATHSSVLA